VKEVIKCYSPEMFSEWHKVDDIEIFEIKIPDIFYQMGAQFKETMDNEMADYEAGKYFEIIGNIYENKDLLK